MNANFLKLIFVTIPAADPQKTSEFYAKQMGIEFGRTFSKDVVSYHAPMLPDGTQLTVQQKFSEHDSTTCYFAVEDMDEAIKSVVEGGGKVATAAMPLTVPKSVFAGFVANVSAFFGVPPENIKDTIGVGAVVQDPAGNRLGLIQFEPFMHAMYSIGAYAKELPPTHVNSHRLTVAMGQLFDKLNKADQ